MDDFIAYLENAFQLNYVEGKYNHVVEDLYDCLVGAYKGKYDTLSITATHIVFSKQGHALREIDIAQHELWGAERDPKDRSHWMSFREAMGIILGYDAQVRQHVKLVEESSDASTYRLLPDSVK